MFYNFFRLIVISFIVSLLVNSCTSDLNNSKNKNKYYGKIKDAFISKKIRNHYAPQGKTFILVIATIPDKLLSKKNVDNDFCLIYGHEKIKVSDSFFEGYITPEGAEIWLFFIISKSQIYLDSCSLAFKDIWIKSVSLKQNTNKYKHRNPGYENLKTVKVIINENLPSNAISKLFVKEDLQEFFDFADVEIADDTSKNFDATFTINIKGEAISAEYNYGGSSTGISYTGASLNGDVNFETPGVLSLSETVEDITEYPSYQTYGQNRKDQAPFDYVYKNQNKYSFSRAIAFIFFKIFGEELFINYMNQDLWSAGLLSYGFVKETIDYGERSVGSLTKIINSKDNGYRTIAMLMLKEINQKKCITLSIENMNDTSQCHYYRGLKFKKEYKTFGGFCTSVLNDISGLSFETDSLIWKEWIKSNQGK